MKSNEELHAEWASAENGSLLRRRLCGEIVEQNKGLVHAQANRLCRNQRIVDDAIREAVQSDGYLALLKAIDKFDISRGFKFTTFAMNVIWNDITKLNIKRDGVFSRKKIRFISCGERMHIASNIDDDTTANMRIVGRIVRNREGWLTQREIEILRARFENIGNTKTLEEVAIAYGLSRQTILNEQKSACLKIKELMK